MSGEPDWYLPYFPELRNRPPWVMEDMIVLEPNLARRAGELQGQAEALAAEIEAVWAAGGWVTVAGSGTSEYSAMAVAEVLEEARRAIGAPGAVEARESFEASLDPRDAGMLLVVSHGARSRAAVSALEAARGRGRTTALITAAASDTPAALVSDLVFVTPQVDGSFCHTIGYLSPILVAAAVVAAFNGVAVDASALGSHLDRALEGGRKEVGAIAARLAGATQYLTSGSGADMVAARELALKIEEGVRVPAAMRGLETLLHGHLVPADGHTSAIFLATDRRDAAKRAERTNTALRAARRLDVRTALVTTSDSAERIDSSLASAGVFVVPDAETLPAALSSLTATAIALQQLTVGLVHEAGVNPDLIRREEEPYRDAAALTEAKIR